MTLWKQSGYGERAERDFHPNIVHSQKGVQPGLMSTLVWFRGTGYFFQTPVPPEMVLGHSHLLIWRNTTKSLQIFCPRALGHYHITPPAKYVYFYHLINGFDPSHLVLLVLLQLMMLEKHHHGY
ncbi:hypothetical protein GH733_017054 [Mirounga leonina]|nr:hypothetical protein GH733_017054 [Mirounga leonina]